MSNKEKTKQLGMNPSTAQHKLRKAIIFNLVKELSLDNCFQCGERIDNIDEFSIEHKTPWLHSDDPKRLFFDLENIAFSHLHCNVSAKRRPIGTSGTSYDKSRRGPNKYKAVISVNGKNKNLGWYSSIEEASKRYYEELSTLPHHLVT